MMFIVHNTTDKTILLSDLRAEIRPRGILDLEKVATRESIDRSPDLKFALRTKRLQMGRHSVIHTKAYKPNVAPTHVIERETVIEKELDEEKMAAVIRKVLAENEKPVAPVQPKENIKEEVEKAVKSGMGELISSIREQLNNVQASPSQKQSPFPIDPAKFAEISQKSIDKVAKEIETGDTKKPKKIQFINKDLKGLADELG